MLNDGGAARSRAGASAPAAHPAHPEYTEIDGTRAVPFQRRIRKLYVDVPHVGDKVSFRYSANSRAKDIVDEMRKNVPLNPKKPAEIESISLLAVRDAVKRTKFFTELIKDVTGFKFERANARVERL